MSGLCRLAGCQDWADQGASLCPLHERLEERARDRADREAASARATAAAPSVYDEIAAERREQDRRWGGAEHDDEHDVWDWSQYIKQHLHRAVIAGKSVPFDGTAYRRQMVRVAALAVAAIEAHDREFPRAADGAGKGVAS